VNPLGARCGRRGRDHGTRGGVRSPSNCIVPVKEGSRGRPDPGNHSPKTLLRIHPAPVNLIVMHVSHTYGSGFSGTSCSVR